MKVTYGPIVTEASGRFGGMVFSRWQGVPVVRRFVPPAQPRTVQQVGHRSLFTALTRAYFGLSELQYWALFWGFVASGMPGIGRNFFLEPNLMLDWNAADLSGFQIFPVDQLAPGPASVTADVATAGEIEFTVVSTGVTIPTGYRLVRVWCFAAEDLSPAQGIPTVTGQSSEVSTPGSVGFTFTGYTAGDDVRGFAVLEIEPTTQMAGGAPTAMNLLSPAVQATGTVT